MKGEGEQRNVHLKGLFAGAIVVLGAAIAVWILWPKGVTRQDSASTKRGLIKEVKPSLSSNELARAAERLKPQGVDTNSIKWKHSVAVTNGTLVTYPNDPTTVRILTRPEMKLPFKDFPDNEIASILSIKPGDTAIIVPLPRNFDQLFANSLTTKIVIEPDDPPEVAEMKRQVLETRKLLVEAVKNGESPRKILTEERKNLHRLMTIRDNYQRILNDQIREGASPADLQDTVQAANQLLKKEGVENPIRLPRKIRLQLEKPTGKVKTK